MGTETAIPALLVIALSIAALGMLSIWLRVREVVGTARSTGAREPNFWFWVWQIIKLLIVVGAFGMTWFITEILWR
jgi:hypothetical protein